LDQILKSNNIDELQLIKLSNDEMNIWHARAKEDKGRYADRIKILLKFFKQINDAISLIEAGIETAMKSPVNNFLI